jgi:mannose-6-phosphate isomerase-like protein (cupin superfamily)
MNLQQLGQIKKGWGFELILANNDKYCGKLLVFDRAGSKTSLVLHKEKKKSWFVNAGRFKVTFIDTASGESKEVILEEGKTVDFGELTPHRVEALVANSIIFEVGTTDYIEDRIRLAPGDSQTKPSEQQ